MNFLVDAQLPERLAQVLRDHGHDALHSSVLPNGNGTTDAEIASAADSDRRVLITKDRDFRDSHLLRGIPAQLLAVATGNISNADLIQLFERHLAQIVEALGDARFVELTATELIVHEARP